MWLWDIELRTLGFRRKSDRYWQCLRRFELPDAAYLSLFSWSEQCIPDGNGRYLVELSAFHVTFRIGLERIHFYYHERSENAWTAAGHTSSREIRRLGVEPAQLRAQADAVAAAFIAALGGAYHPRHSRNLRDGIGSTD
jgi:hypothetical protein